MWNRGKSVERRGVAFLKKRVRLNFLKVIDCEYDAKSSTLCRGNGAILGR
jgi:hypothetical protein